MRKLITWMAVGLILALIILTPLGQITGQEPSLPAECENLAFSTEEDFVTHGPVPPDGNPIISDGDLLGPECVICARNLDLVGKFDVSADLGLDAADVIDVEGYLVAFSTELDSPNVGQFTAGDLLVTDGVIIPNIALTHPYTVGYDIGLDALHFVGAPQNIIAFLNAILEQQLTREYWLANPGALSPMLARHAIDIWFSTEGTLGPVTAPVFLDGDLLSARDGGIVAGNDDLLPPSVPAGIPTQGVDFGLDAVTSDRAGDKPQIHFSTEILYQDEFSFTDGDVLKYGNGVTTGNWDLIQCFEPRANFLGLDALHMALERLPIGAYLPVILKDFD
jgi:hypothetical protein